MEDHFSHGPWIIPQYGMLYFSHLLNVIYVGLWVKPDSIVQCRCGHGIQGFEASGEL